MKKMLTAALVGALALVGTAYAQTAPTDPPAGPTSPGVMNQNDSSNLDRSAPVDQDQLNMDRQSVGGQQNYDENLQDRSSSTTGVDNQDLNTQDQGLNNQDLNNQNLSPTASCEPMIIQTVVPVRVEDIQAGKLDSILNRPRQPVSGREGACEPVLVQLVIPVLANQQLENQGTSTTPSTTPSTNPSTTPSTTPSDDQSLDQKLDQQDKDWDNDVIDQGKDLDVNQNGKSDLDMHNGEAH